MPRTPRLSLLALALVLALAPALPLLAAPASAAKPAVNPAESPFTHLAFRNLGPAVAGGRVTAIAGIPGNPRVFYVGAASGGVWKTVDGGLHFTSIFGKEGTSSIGAVALAPSNPNIVWVGTGEANIRSDVIGGDGVYVSTDAGQSFHRVLDEHGQVGRILIDPQNPEHVLVAVLGNPWKPNAARGVFETTDGGKTWHKSLFVNDGTGAVDLAWAPSNPKVVFAATWQANRTPWTLNDGGPGSGIWRSNDGGATWTELHDGLPKGPLGRIGLAVAPSQPDLVYALVEAKRGEGLLFSSNDLGEHWHQVSDNYALDVRPFYFSTLAVAPNDPQRVYFNSFYLMVSNNGGKTAKPLDKSVHVDHHALWIDPTDPERILEGNDGGAYASLDGGKTWRFLDDLPIEQVYAIATDNRKPFDVCVGLQDNSGWCGPSNTMADNVISAYDWYTVVGGDGEYAVPAPSDADVIYSNAEDGATMQFNRRTKLSRFAMPYLHGPGAVNDLETKDQKYRFNWTAPIAVDPNDAKTVYLGANVLFKSTDGGLTWTVDSPDLTRNDKSKQLNSGGPVNKDISGAETYDTIQSIAIAPQNPDVIWVGTDDGLVQVTRDGGKTWHDVTPGGAPKWARVYQIGASPFTLGTAYLSFDAHMLADNKPYVYKTTDYGAHWRRIDSGLPDNASTLVVREDPRQRGFLAAGTMTGVWISHDDGAHWNKLVTHDFPTTPVWDLNYAQGDLVLGTHGNGVWIFDHLAPIAQWRPAIAQDKLHVFTPSTGIEWQRWARGEGAEPAFTTPNPPNGVILDYWLPKKLQPSAAEKAGKRTPVKIVVSNAQGQVIATRWGPAKAGINRFAWDMTWDGYTRLDFGDHHIKSANNSGPMALPGNYTVTLSANGVSKTVPVTVQYDPNQQFDAAANAATLVNALALRNRVDALNQMLNRLSAWQTALQGYATTAENASSSMDATQRALLDQAKALDKQVTALRNSIYNPLLQHEVIEDDIHYLQDLHANLEMTYQMVASLQNQAPTPPMQSLMTEYGGQLAQKLASFNALLGNGVAAWNAAAYKAGAPTLSAGAPIGVAPTPAIGT